MTPAHMTRAVVLLAFLGAAAGAGAQALPAQPISVADGRLVLGGDVAVAVGPDDPGFFNYTDYEHNALRELRLGLSASLRATDRIAVLGEVRSENFDRVSPFALYARIRPFPHRRLDVQIGRIPPTFGAFTRRAYSRDNPLIGSPLAYQYLTSLRADAAPASADELLRMRARGWRAEYGVGNAAPGPGVPLVAAFRWDTGVQVSTGWGMVGIAGSITNGSASNPRLSDDNSGKQLAARVTVAPAAGLVIGSSFSRGEFLGSAVANALPSGPRDGYVQRAHGLDAEYSLDRWLVRADAVYSQWQLPLFDEPLSRGRLRALALAVEGRYTIVPGAYAAARAEHLAFSRIAGSVGIEPWDAPVSRVEIGGGYYVQRNVVARASWQHNARGAGRIRSDRLLAAQLLFWF